MNIEKGIQVIKLQGEASAADRIRRYLMAPDDETVELSENDKKRYDILKEIHALRMRHTRKADIVQMIKHLHGLKTSQCYNYIRECQNIFGPLEEVHKDYERNYLLEASRKNIEIAMASKNSDLITKAILAHHKLSGLADITVEMPDFSRLEPNTYEFNLPEAQQNMFKTLLEGGVIDWNVLFPHQDMVIDVSHKDVTDGDSPAEQ